MIRQNRRGARRRHVQLALDEARTPEPGKHGGWRPGAGRRKKPGAISHSTRPSEPGRFPQHVTLRIAGDAPSLARERCMKIIRRAVRDSHKGGFRICEFNVLGNHMHLVTEAVSKEALSAGIAGFEVRVARRLNAALMLQANARPLTRHQAAGVGQFWRGGRVSSGTAGSWRSAEGARARRRRAG